MLNSLTSPGYYLINNHLHQIEPTVNNHHPISVTLYFMKKLDDQILTIQASDNYINHADEETKETLERHESEFTNIKTIIAQLLIQDKNYSTDKVDSPKDQDTDTILPGNKIYSPLESGHYMRTGGMWTLKHDIYSPEFY